MGSFYFGQVVINGFLEQDPASMSGLSIAGGIASIVSSFKLLSIATGKIDFHYLDKDHNYNLPQSERSVTLFTQDENGDTVMGAVISIQDALNITENRWEDYKDKYEDEGQSFIDGNFGFQRSKIESLEISLIDKEWGAYVWHDGIEEGRLLGRRTRKTSSFEVSKASKELTLQCVEHFFNLPPSEFIRFIKENGAKAD